MTTTIIPAQPGFYTLTLGKDGGENACAVKTPIIAWAVSSGRLAPYTVLPITIDPAQQSEVIYCETTDRVVNTLEAEEWDTVASWVHDEVAWLESEQTE